jgi:5-formyltetrahydrofolate cyclo-ligase
MNSSAALDKRAQRALLLQKRAQLPAAGRIAAAQALVERLDELPELLTDQLIAGYWANGGELSLHALVSRILRREQQYFLPVLPARRDAALVFAPWRTGEPVLPNRYGIPEPQVDPERMLAPEALQLVFVPLLGFDRRGNRLGMGAGFYDRSFAFLRGGERPREPLLVGIGYGFQEVERIEPEAHDVRLDFVATERELIDCAA